MKTNSEQIENSYAKTFAFCTNFNKKYKILDKIGSGDSANIFLVQNKLNKKKFALKAFNHLSTQGILLFIK